MKNRFKIFGIIAIVFGIIVMVAVFWFSAAVRSDNGNEDVSISDFSGFWSGDAPEVGFVNVTILDVGIWSLTLGLAMEEWDGGPVSVANNVATLHSSDHNNAIVGTATIVNDNRLRIALREPSDILGEFEVIPLF